MPNSLAILLKSIYSMENKMQAYGFLEKDLLLIMKPALDYILENKRFLSQMFVVSNIEFCTGEL